MFISTFYRTGAFAAFDRNFVRGGDARAQAWPARHGRIATWIYCPPSALRRG